MSASPALFLGCVSFAKSEPLEQQIRVIQKKASLPALQVMVAEAGRPRFQYVEGVRAVGFANKVTDEDRWHLGSCTKQMTAVLIGQLVDEKLLTWATPLVEIMPSKFKLHPSVQKITIEQMLAHGSGLADVLEPEGGKLWPQLFAEESETSVLRERLVRALVQVPTRFEPGAKFEYSNSGYVILGWVIEHFRKRSWEHVVRTELFRKLEMHSCGFGSAGDEDIKRPSHPWPHKIVDERRVALVPGVQSDNPRAIGPAGNVHCTTQDWHRFLRIFTDQGGSAAGIVSRETHAKLLSRWGHQVVTFSSMGRIEREWAGGPVFSMAGSNSYNFALVLIAPARNLIFTVNTNAGDPVAEAASTEILKLLIEQKF